MTSVMVRLFKVFISPANNSVIPWINQIILINLINQNPPSSKPCIPGQLDPGRHVQGGWTPKLRIISKYGVAQQLRSELKRDFWSFVDEEKIYIVNLFKHLWGEVLHRHDGSLTAIRVFQFPCVFSHSCCSGQLDSNYGWALSASKARESRVKLHLVTEALAHTTFSLLPNKIFSS